jgi:hypothetical protein
MAKIPKFIQARRNRLITPILDALTGPDGPSLEEFESQIMRAKISGILEVIRKFTSSNYASVKSMQTEMRIGVVCWISNDLMKDPEAK